MFSSNEDEGLQWMMNAFGRGCGGGVNDVRGSH